MDERRGSAAAGDDGCCADAEGKVITRGVGRGVAGTALVGARTATDGGGVVNDAVRCAAGVWAAVGDLAAPLRADEELAGENSAVRSDGMDCSEDDRSPAATDVGCGAPTESPTR